MFRSACCDVNGLASLVNSRQRTSPCRHLWRACISCLWEVLPGGADVVVGDEPHQPDSRWRVATARLRFRQPTFHFVRIHLDAAWGATAPILVDRRKSF